ncbi:transmembrane protein 243b isoform X2 [Syngnathoides biaculeatus]|uniref:transmembrane protein 243b isoform X2 n=1 Tax=Syngnathoides biaculeatus TaxID=300417 RepID=UPI002ADE18C2|nr:transmembrane protein 243b isoform X2 [Syngnathoides biaculeatus]
MDDFGSRTYGTSGLDNRPLFGETSARDRIINLAVGGFTSLVVLVTVISSFVFPSLPPRPLNIFFAVCILLACGSALLLVCSQNPSLTLAKNESGYFAASPSDLLVPPRRPGAQIPQPDLLQAGVHRVAVFVRQPLLPRRQVSRRRTDGTGPARTRLLALGKGDLKALPVPQLFAVCLMSLTNDTMT